MRDDFLSDLEKIKERYPEREAALLPALYLAQRKFGWLSSEAMESVSDSLYIPRAVVKGVATFYSMYKNRQMGRHLIQLCTNVSCMLFGAERLVDILYERYGLTPNGTTADGRFSLMIMECIGACHEAPAMLVDADLHCNLNENSIEEILERYK
ncbi:MAG: NADH-quinone oxidoreductase subunit NuoE [Thermodesulfovibrionales bacterium]